MFINWRWDSNDKSRRSWQMSKTQEYDTLKQEIESLKQEAKNMDRDLL